MSVEACQNDMFVVLLYKSGIKPSQTSVSLTTTEFKDAHKYIFTRRQEHNFRKIFYTNY